MIIRNCSFFVIALSLTGCSPEIAPVTVPQPASRIAPSDNDGQTYLSCEAYRVDYEGGGLVVLSNDGTEIVRHDRARLNRSVGPMWTNGGDPSCTDTIPVSFDGSHGFLLPTGKLFANQLFEGSAGLFKDTLAFEKDKKWGLMSNDGVEVLKPIHDNIFWFEPDRWMVTYNDENYLVDMNGERLPPADDDYLSLKYGKKHSKRSEYISCPDGTKLQSKNGLWGIIDADSNIVIEPKFRALHCLQNDLSLAANDAKKSWCFVDRKGEFTEDSCETTHPIYFRLHVLPEKFSEDLYENGVLWMRAYLAYGESDRDEPPSFVSDGGWSSGGIAGASHHKY